MIFFVENNYEDNQAKTKSFDFEPYQVTVADAALLLDISTSDVYALVRMGYLKVEGQRPYKIDIRSIVEYKRAMPKDAEEEEKD